MFSRWCGLLLIVVDYTFCCYIYILRCSPPAWRRRWPPKQEPREVSGRLLGMSGTQAQDHSWPPGIHECPAPRRCGPGWRMWRSRLTSRSACSLCKWWWRLWNVSQIHFLLFWWISLIWFRSKFNNRCMYLTLSIGKSNKLENTNQHKHCHISQRLKNISVNKTIASKGS